MGELDLKAARKRLKKFRGRYGAVSERSGISRSWLSKFACGRRGKRPGFDLINRLIAALDRLEAEAKPPRKRAAPMGSAR